MTFSKHTLNSVGKKFKQARIKAKKTQRELAVLFKYKTPQLISNVERGICMPTKVMLKWMVANNANPKELLIKDIRQQLCVKNIT